MDIAQEAEEKIREHSKKVQKEERNRLYLIAVDGMCASGKTTLSEKVQKECPDIAVVHMDDFFLTPGQRTKERLREVGGNIDYERFQKEVLKPLLTKGSCTYRIYDCHTQCFVGEKKIEKAKTVLVEGAYSRHPYFKNPYDEVYFLSISREEQIERIRKRNGEKMLKRFMEEWIPKENEYFKNCMK